MTHILVVDDSLYQRLLIQKHLTARNHDVLLAKTGKEGLEIIAEQNPDLVLLDLVMPEMSGLEMLQRLREQGRRVPPGRAALRRPRHRRTPRRPAAP